MQRLWCLERCELQTRRLSFLQSGFEAITIALCIVLQEQRLWSRWFADGEDQEVHTLWIHRRTRLVSDRTWRKSHQSTKPPSGLVDPGRIWVHFGPLHQTVGACGVNKTTARLSVMSNGLQYRQRPCRAFICHTAKEWWGGRLSLGGFILFHTLPQNVFQNLFIQGFKLMAEGIDWASWLQEVVITVTIQTQTAQRRYDRQH